MEQTINTFSQGLNTDLNPLVTPSDVMTNCLNGTLVTYNGNEMVLQNDMGNGRVETAALWDGYVPIGMKEHGGIIYVASYNPESKRSQLGCFPSPERNVEDLLTPKNIPNLILGNCKIPLFKEGALHAGDKYQAFLPTSLNYTDVTPSFDNSGGPYTARKDRYSIQMCVLNNNGELVDITDTCKPHSYNGKNYWFNVADSAPTTIDYNVCHGKPAGKPYINCIENQVISMEAGLFVYKHPETGNLLYRPDVTMIYNCPAYTVGNKGLRGFEVTVQTLASSASSWANTSHSKIFEIGSCKESQMADNNFTLRYFNKTDYTELPKDIYAKEHSKIKFIVKPVFNYGSDYTQNDMAIEITMDVDRIGDNTTTLTTWKTTYEDNAIIITYGFESYISNEDFLPQNMYIRFHKPTVEHSTSEEHSEHYTFKLSNLQNLILDDVKNSRFDADDIDYVQFIGDKSSYNGMFSEYISQDDLEPETFYIAELGYISLNPEYKVGGKEPQYKLFKNYQFVITTALYNEEYLGMKDFSTVTPKVKVKPIVQCNLKTKLLSNEVTQDNVEMIGITKPALKEDGKLTVSDTYKFSITPTFKVKQNPLYPVQIKLENPTLSLKENTDTHDNFSGQVTFVKSNKESEEDIYILTYTIEQKVGYDYERSAVNISKLFETYESRNLTAQQIGGGHVKIYTRAHNDSNLFAKDDYYLKYNSYTSSNVPVIKGKIIWEKSANKSLCDGRLSDCTEEVDTACLSTAANKPLAVRVSFDDIYLIDVNALSTFREKMTHHPDVFYYATNWLVYNGETYILLRCAMDPKGNLNNIKDEDPHEISDFGTNPYNATNGILKQYAVCTEQNVSKEDIWKLKLTGILTKSEEFSYTPQIEVTGTYTPVYKDIKWDISDFKDSINSVTDATNKAQLNLIAKFADFKLDDDHQIAFNNPSFTIQKTGTETFEQLIQSGQIPCALIYGSDHKMIFPTVEMDEETIYKITISEGKVRINSTDRLTRAKENGMYHALFQTYDQSSTKLGDSPNAKNMYFGYINSIQGIGTGFTRPYIIVPDDKNSYRIWDANGKETTVSRSYQFTADSETVTVPSFYNSVSGAKGRMLVESTYNSACVDLIDEFNS